MQRHEFGHEFDRAAVRRIISLRVVSGGEAGENPARSRHCDRLFGRKSDPLLNPNVSRMGDANPPRSDGL
jgi:hypothetical protein